MSGGAKYFIVEAEAMPEIIRKVAEAKRLLETGEKTTVNGAAGRWASAGARSISIRTRCIPFRICSTAGSSRSRPYCGMSPGVLSGVLNVFAGTGINILTINQNIPVNGCAVVTITAETSALRRSLEELLAAAGGSPGVLRCEILAG